MKRQLPVLPPEWVDKALPGGAFSHSQYSTYKACPKAYEFKYLLNDRPPPSPALTKGLAVHAGVEHALRARMGGASAPMASCLDAVSDAFAQADQTTWSAEEPEGKFKDEAVRLFQLYYTQALPNMRPLAVEEPFVAKVGTVTVRGVIDLIDGASPTGLAGHVVVDLKTSSAKWSQTEVDREPQLTLYTAVKGAYHARIDNLVSTKTPAYHGLPTTRDGHAHRLLVEDYEETVDYIKRGLFPRTALDAWACTAKWCAHWTQCRGKRT